LEATPFSQVEWQRAKGHRKDSDPAMRAASFFVYCRQSLSGRMKSFAPITRNRTRRRMNEQASAWIGAVDGLNLVHARLRRVVILNERAVDVIRSQDGPNTLFYLDPPYVHDTRMTTGEYGDQEMTLQEHEELVDTLQGCAGKVMVSMYHHPLYDGLVQKQKWRLEEFNLPNNASSGGYKRRMIECVFMNF
jgi:DNA adenine methylase